MRRAIFAIAVAVAAVWGVAAAEDVTLDELTLEAPPPVRMLKHKVVKGATIADCELTPERKKAVAWSAMTMFSAMRIGDAAADCALKATDTQGLQFDFSFSLDGIPHRVKLKVQAAPDPAKTEVLAVIETDRALRDAQVRVLWDDFLLKKSVAEALKEPAEWARAYDRLGPFWSMSEYLIATAKADRYPATGMNRDEVNAAFGAPVDWEHGPGTDVQQHLLVGGDVLTISFDGRGIVSDYSRS